MSHLSIIGQGKGKDICGVNGKTFVLGLGNSIWVYGNRIPTNNTNNPGTRWAELPGGGRAKTLSIDPTNNRAWVIGMNNISCYIF